MTLKKGDNTLKKSTIFLEIIRLIPEDRYITQREISLQLKQAGFRVETRTLQRYLDRISSTPTFQIELDARSRPYGYKKLAKLNSIEPQKMGPADYLLLKLAQEHMRQRMPSKLSSGLKPFFEQAAHYMSDRNKNAEKDWLKKVVALPEALEFDPPKVRPAVFETVSEALFEGRMLEIEYRTAEGSVKKRIVHPLGLVQQDVRLFLVCSAKDDFDIKSLPLHRINQAKVTSTKATAPKGFDIKAYVKRFLGEEKDRWVRLAFEFTNPLMKVRLEESPLLGKSQKIQKISKKKWKVTAVLRDSPLLNAWLAANKDEAGIGNVRREAVRGR